MFATPVKIGDFYYELSGTTATVTKHNDYKTLTQAIIPSSVVYESHTYTVTAIAEDAFNSCKELLSVSIPSSVTSVGDNAFAYCTWLDSVAWNPVQLTYESYASNTCPFYNDAKITKFTFGAGVKRIPYCLCYNLDGLKEINLPAGLQYIGTNAFTSIDSLTAVVLPEGLSSVGNYVFSSCARLASINIPSTLTAIGKGFCKGTGLTEITIPSTVTSIGEEAFNGTKLTSVTIPEGVTVVGNTAFAYNSYLTTVVWNPVKLTEGYSAYNVAPFYTCPNVMSFTFGENVQRIPTFLCYQLNGITSLELPAGLEFIGRYAFSGLKQITEVTVPDGVNSMGSGIFSSCTNLASVNIPTSITYVPDHYCYGTAITEIEIPSSVTSIETYAFGSTKLTSITIPEGVTSVGTEAFSTCKDLKYVVWNAKNASNSYASNTHPFVYCNLNSITFGEKVTYISPYLCFDQPNLAEIYNYAATPQTINSNVFYNVPKSTCQLYVPKESLEDYKAKAVWQDFLNIVGVLSTLKYADSTTTVTYLGQLDTDTLHQASLTLRMPVAPTIDGFHFVKWEVLPGDFADGIVLQAIYEAGVPTPAPVVANPANPAQKLIRRGNVYILRDDKMYTLTGASVAGSME